MTNTSNSSSATPEGPFPGWAFGLPMGSTKATTPSSDERRFNITAVTGVLTASLLIGSAIGAAIGFGLYFMTYDPTDETFLANLGPALLGLVVGGITGLVAQAVATASLITHFHVAMRTRTRRVAIALPLLLGIAFAVPPFNYVAALPMLAVSAIVPGNNALFIAGIVQYVATGVLILKAIDTH